MDLSHDITGVFNRADWLTAQTDAKDASRNVQLAYDVNGNVTQKTTAASSRSFRWDARDTLTAVLDNGVAVGRYDYDRNLQRVKRTAGAERVEYVLDDKYVLQEADGSQTSHPATRRYHYAAQPLAVTTGAVTSYLNVDALGSVTDATSSTGAVTTARQYDAWGQYRNNTAPTPTEPKLGFTGHQFDVETGLVYARARYYDPELGRFLSRDLLEGNTNDAPSLHRYAYVRQNPTRWTDFEGLADDKPAEKDAEPSVRTEAEPYVGQVYQQEVSKLSQEELAAAVRKVALLTWSRGSLEGKTHQELVGLLCGYMQCKTSDVSYILSLVKGAAAENGAKFGDFVSSRPIVQKAGNALKVVGTVIEEGKEAIAATAGDKLADATYTPGAIRGAKFSQTVGDLGKKGTKATLDLAEDQVLWGVVGLGAKGLGALAGELKPIAVGLSRSRAHEENLVARFADKIGATTYWDEYAVAATSNQEIVSRMVSQFEKRSIRVNLSGLEQIRTNGVERGLASILREANKGVTEAEISHVVANAEFFGRTKFYLNGKEVLVNRDAILRFLK